MSPADRIAAEFGCSKLAAQEICSAAKDLANRFVAIHNAYDLTHVLDAKRALRRLPLGTSKADEPRKVRWAISRAANTLFKEAKRATQVMDRFRTALNVANCQNFPGQREALTATLTALHEARQMTTPSKVGDGRFAYESLHRDYVLLDRLGVY